MFWKKTLNSDEYEKLYKKFTELQNLVNELTSKIAAVQSDNANLRGQFNRKLQGIKKEEQITEEIEETKNINSPVILPDNGIVFRHR